MQPITEDNCTKHCQPRKPAPWICWEVQWLFIDSCTQSALQYAMIIVNVQLGTVEGFSHFLTDVLVYFPDHAL